MHKKNLLLSALALGVVFLGGCSTNPATGEQQFTAFMPAGQEAQIGAQEHQKVLKQYSLYEDDRLQKYVSDVGTKIVQGTERRDVQYKFYLLDSPIVNAFALPGGYVYLTRGLMALANSEAEMAGVVAHEIGHITARHSAERYSQGLLTALGSSVLSAAIGSDGVSSALGLGSNLYMSSYSRGQENQADTLGIRYLSRAGYDTRAMSWFLSNLRANTALGAKMDGEKASDTTDYFATHPATAERVTKTRGEAKGYKNGGAVGSDSYLSLLNGMTYGDSNEQGFVRGQSFYHPEIGFMYTVPQGFKIVNQPSQVLAAHKTNGAVVIFDMVPNKSKRSMAQFMNIDWLQENPDAERIETIRINGMEAATSAVRGSVNGKSMTIRLIAIKWSNQKVARFQIAIPQGVSQSFMNSLKSASYSFKRLSASEKEKFGAYKIRVYQAKAGDTVSSMARLMAPEEHKVEHFRVLNGLAANEGLVAGRLYKVVVQ